MSRKNDPQRQPHARLTPPPRSWAPPTWPPQQQPDDAHPKMTEPVNVRPGDPPLWWRKIAARTSDGDLWEHRFWSPSAEPDSAATRAAIADALALITAEARGPGTAHVVEWYLVPLDPPQQVGGADLYVYSAEQGGWEAITLDPPPPPWTGAEELE